MDGEPDRRRERSLTLENDPDVEVAAVVALAGMDPIAYLREEDPLVQVAIANIARRTLELRRQEAEDLAQVIANRIWAGLSG
jgi:hypothetical protein